MEEENVKSLYRDMTALPHQPAMSVEEYFHLDQSNAEARYEYIDGYVRMLAEGTLDHATISANVHRCLYQALRGGSCRVYTSDARVRLSKSRYVYPDVTVTCDERDRGKQSTIYYPSLVVEVLSPGTRDYDRGGKFTYYRTCPTIQEYVLVDTEYQTVEVFRRQREDLWLLQMFRSDSIVDLVSLNVSFPVASVYEDTIIPAYDAEV
jgi:Uma2 family endonuclease